MHEMGIANSILEAVASEARLYPGHRAAKVCVVIGEYAGVDTESLRFCFEVLAKGQQEPMELEINWHIGSDELKLAYLEMEEVSDEPRGKTMDQGERRTEYSERERSNCGAFA